MILCRLETKAAYNTTYESSRDEWAAILSMIIVVKQVVTSTSEK
jgi:hypothetical protein